MTQTTPTEYPAPEQRVRDFLEAVEQEGEHTGAGEQQELAWAVPDEGPLRSLMTSDLRDVLAELEAARTALEERARIMAGGSL